MFSHVSVHPSICLSTRGGTPARSTPGEGYTTLGPPSVGPGRGYPDRGYPTSGTPIRPGRGYPDRGTPMGVPHLRYRPVRSGWGWGDPDGGVPHLRYPHQTWLGGTLTEGTQMGYPTLSTPPPPSSDLAGGYLDGGVSHLV